MKPATVRMDAPRSCEKAKQHERSALEYIAGRTDGQEPPWETEGVLLQDVEAVLFRKTTPIVEQLGNHTRTVQPPFHIYLRLGDQWFKALEIPHGDSSASSLRERMLRHDASPARVAARLRQEEAAAALREAEEAYRKAMEG